MAINGGKSGCNMCDTLCDICTYLLIMTYATSSDQHLICMLVCIFASIVLLEMFVAGKIGRQNRQSRLFEFKK